MTESENMYNFNFFRPTPGFAQHNARLIAAVVLIWAIAIFGFQTLLKVTEQPAPEAQLAQFEEIWPGVLANNASTQDLKDLSKIYLNLLGRHVALRSNQDFKLGFTSAVYNLLPSNERQEFLSLTNKDFGAIKTSTGEISSKLDLKKDSLLAQVIPYALVPYDGAPVSEMALKKIPTIMQKNLMHYRSALTDTKFLGFPFHYFYTAIFLLVLFIGLCLFYCNAIDKLNIKYDLETEDGKGVYHDK